MKVILCKGPAQGTVVELSDDARQWRVPIPELKPLTLSTNDAVGIFPRIGVAVYAPVPQGVKGYYNAKFIEQETGLIAFYFREEESS